MNRTLGRRTRYVIPSLVAGAALIVAGCRPVTPYIEGVDGNEGKVPAGVTREGNFPLGPNLTYVGGLYTCAGWSKLEGAVAAQRYELEGGGAVCNPLFPGEKAKPDETGRSVVSNFTGDCGVVSEGLVSLTDDGEMSTSNHYQEQRIDCEIDKGEFTGR